VTLLQRCHDNFASFVILGTMLLLLIETWINAGMNMGLFPVVGIPFPFLSAGGTALLAHLALFGVVESIARFEGARGYRVSGTSVI
jgi:cell division protein FtsW (lipid II flippase)